MRTNVGRSGTLLVAVVMALGLFAGPAFAQDDVTQDGLVNVNVGDVTVQAPIGIAANICPQVNAAVLAQQLAQEGTAECDAEVEQGDTVAWGGGDGDVEQSGLVNVNVGDVTVQLPIGIAANVCPQVNAAVLAQQLRQQGTAECDAEVEAGDTIALLGQ